MPVRCFLRFRRLWAVRKRTYIIMPFVRLVVIAADRRFARIENLENLAPCLIALCPSNAFTIPYFPILLTLFAILLPSM